jgi:hypothetical protein
LEGCSSGQQQLQQLTQKHAVSCCIHRVSVLLLLLLLLKDWL